MTLAEIEKTIAANKRDIRLMRLNIKEGYQPERSKQIMHQAQHNIEQLNKLKKKCR